MPVRIRLARHGRKARPFYYIVVADSRAPRDGKFIERIGSYNPITNPATVELDFDKALEWMQKGAQPSDTARNLLQQKGVMYKNHLLKGVKKGALTEEQAEQKFQEWMNQKQQELDGVIEKIKSEHESQAKSRFDAESKIRESMAAELARKRSELVAAETESEETVDEAAEEQPVAQEEAAPVAEETTEAAVKETPAAEEAPEAPVEEAAPVVEEKKEEPAAPAKEEKKEEEKPEAPVEEKSEEAEEAPAEEVKAEEKKEEKLEEKKDEKKEKPAKDEAKEDKKAEEEKSEK